MDNLVEAGGRSNLRIRSLDGVRGLAILMVLIGHAVCPLPFSAHFWKVAKATASLGTYGVDLFFVLSGFLITNVLNGQKNRTRFLRAFWIRRAARIYPVYLLTLVALTLVCYFWIPDQWPEIPLWAYPLHLQNFFLVTGSRANHLGYDISWSLAIEDHFYLIYPLLFLLSGRKRFFCIAAMCLAGPVMRYLVHPWAEQEFSLENLNFFMLSGRVDQLAVGALTAMLLTSGKMPEWLQRALHSFAIPALLWCVVAILHLLKISDALVTALAASATIAHVMTSPGSLISLGMRSNSLVFMGRISYALYLFHSPFIFVALRASDFWIIPYISLGLVVTFVLSYLSTRYMEEPISAKARAYSQRFMT